MEKPGGGVVWYLFYQANSSASILKSFNENR